MAERGKSKGTKAAKRVGVPQRAVVKGCVPLPEYAELYRRVVEWERTSKQTRHILCQVR